MELITHFLQPIFLLNFLYFCAAVFVSATIPGDVVISQLRYDSFSRYVLATVVGIALWGLQGFIFGFIGMRSASYVYILLFFCIWVYLIKQQKIRNPFMSQDKSQGDILLSAIIVLGIIVQLVSIIFNGIETASGLYFCCGTPDSLYHAALTNELTKNVPPFEPGMVGVVVKNYHYLSNLVVAEWIRIFHLPLLATAFNYVPLLLTVLLAISSAVFARQIYDNKIFVRWFVFFILFSGDFIYLLTFLLGRGFLFNITLGENPTTFWISPPRVFAMVIMLAALSLFVHFIKKNKLSTGILVGILFGSLVGFKLYLSFFIISGLTTLTVYKCLKKQYMYFIVFLVAAGVSLLLYFPVNGMESGLFFSGLWRFENFAARKEFGLGDMEGARQVYLMHKNWIRVSMTELFYALFYITSLLGVFIFGFFQTKKSMSFIPKEFHILLLSGLCFSLVPGFFYLQKVGGANTIQFLFSVYIVGSIYTALAVSSFTKKASLKSFLIISILILITIPRVIIETNNNFASLMHKKGFIIDNSELQGIRYLKTYTNKNAIIMLDQGLGSVHPNKTDNNNSLYYMNFLANRPIFLTGVGILDDHGVNTKQRTSLQKIVFNKNDPILVKRALIKNKIEYIYVSSLSSIDCLKQCPFLRPVFKNHTRSIYKVSIGKEKIL